MTDHNDSQRLIEFLRGSLRYAADGEPNINALASLACLEAILDDYRGALKRIAGDNWNTLLVRAIANAALEGGEG